MTDKVASIVGDFQKRIIGGEFSPAEKLPPLRHLAEDYGVCYVTVQKAIQSLAKRGVIHCRNGAGSYVNPEFLNSDTKGCINILFCGEHVEELVVGVLNQAMDSLKIHGFRGRLLHIDHMPVGMIEEMIRTTESSLVFGACQVLKAIPGLMNVLQRNREKVICIGDHFEAEQLHCVMCMAFPRAAALAEKLWREPGECSYRDFLDRLLPHRKRFRMQQVNACPIP